MKKGKITKATKNSAKENSTNIYVPHKTKALRKMKAEHLDNEEYIGNLISKEFDFEGDNDNDNDNDSQHENLCDNNDDLQFNDDKDKDKDEDYTPKCEIDCNKNKKKEVDDDNDIDFMQGAGNKKRKRKVNTMKKKALKEKVVKKAKKPSDDSDSNSDKCSNSGSDSDYKNNEEEGEKDSIFSEPNNDEEDEDGFLNVEQQDGGAEGEITGPTSDENPHSNTTWSKIDYTFQPPGDMTEKPKSTSIPEEALSNPYAIFRHFFDCEFFDLMVDQTNLYASQYMEKNRDFLLKHPRARTHRWKPVTIDEIKAYLGIIMLMGVHSTPSIRDYWSRNIYLQHPIQKIMSIEKFVLIHKFFHLVDNNVDKDIQMEDKLYKVGSLKKIIDKYAELYSPSDKLVIDEGVIPFKGKSSIKQYMPFKPTKWGMKAFLLCDSTNGYNLNTLFYSGKQSFICNKSKYIGFNVVMDLMDPYKYQNYKLFIDSFYTSYDLVKELETLNIRTTGTFFSNRKGFPKCDQKLKKHEFVAYKEEINSNGNNNTNSNSNTLVVYWEDTVRVNVISNTYSNKTLSKNKKTYCKDTPLGKSYTKPEMIEKYGMFMGGVDLHNQYCYSYRFPHRSMKWWRVFFYQVIQMSVVNSFIICKEFYNKKYEREKFVLNIIDSLLNLKADRGGFNLNKGDYLLNNNNKMHTMRTMQLSDNGVMKKNYYYSNKSKVISHHINYSKERKSRRCIICNRRSRYVCQDCSDVGERELSFCVVPCFRFHQDDLMSENNI